MFHKFPLLYEFPETLGRSQALKIELREAATGAEIENKHMLTGYRFSHGSCFSKRSKLIADF